MARWDCCRMWGYRVSSREPWHTQADSGRGRVMAAESSAALLRILPATAASGIRYRDNYFYKQLEVAVSSHVDRRCSGSIGLPPCCSWRHLPLSGQRRHLIGLSSWAIAAAAQAQLDRIDWPRAHRETSDPNHQVYHLVEESIHSSNNYSMTQEI